MAEEHVVRITADTSDVNSTLNNTAQTLDNVDRAADRTSGVISRFFSKLSKHFDTTSKEIEDFITDFSDITDVNDLTKRFNLDPISKEFDRTSKHMDQLIARQEKMNAMGVDKSSNSFRSLQYDINATSATLDTLTSKFTGDLERAVSTVSHYMESIAEQTVPTAEYEDLTRKADEAQAAVDKLIEQQIKLATAVETKAMSTTQYQQAADAADFAREQVERIQAEMAQMSDKGSASYKRLENDLKMFSAALRDAQNTQKSLVDSAIDVASQDQKWQDLENQIEKASEQVSNYRKEMQAMEQAGTATISGSQTDTYAGAQKQLDDYRAQIEAAQASTAGYMSKAESGLSAMFGKIMRGSAKVGNSIIKHIGDSFKRGLKSAQNAVKSLISHITSLNRHTKSTTSIANKMTKSILSMFSMLKTRLKNFAITAIFGDIKESFGAIAKISPRFNDAVSSMIDSAKRLGTQIIAAIEPIISLAGPIISNLIDRLAAGADAMSQFLARATGNEEYLKAIKGQSDYAASLDNSTASTKKATKAAEEYHESVLGFDELNKLSGSSTDASDITGIDKSDLEKAKTDATKLNEIADKINEAFKKGDYTGAGKAMADAVNDAFAWLANVAGWTKNQEKFSKAIQAFIDTVNGFVDGLDPKVIGGAIADVANTIVNGWDMLVDPRTGIDFEKIGKKIGETLLNTVTNIEWTKIGRAFVNSIQGGVKMINGLLESTIIDELTGEHITVGTAIGNSLNDLFTGAINAINPDDWGNLISNLINNMSDLIVAFLEDQSKIEKFATSIADTLNTAIAGIEADDLAKAISVMAETIVTFFATLFKQVDWKAIWGKMVEVISSEEFDWGAVLTAMGIFALGNLLAGALTTPISSAISALVGVGLVSIKHEVDLILAQIEQAKDNAEKAADIKEEVELSTGISPDFSNIKSKNIEEAWAAANQIVGGTGDIGRAGAIVAERGGAYTDANNNFVLMSDQFGTELLTAQNYVDMFASEIDGLNAQTVIYDGRIVEVTESMREAAQACLDSGTASWGAAEQMDALTMEMSDFANTLSEADARIANMFANSADLPDTYRVNGYARGGVVGDGQLFIANENGAELIGSDGRGNTAIVNNQQIIGAVVSGVKQAVTAAGMMIAEKVTSSSSAGGDIVLNVDSVELARANTKGQRQINRRSNHKVSFA